MSKPRLHLMLPLLVLLLATLACAIDFNPPPIVTPGSGNPSETPRVVTAVPPTAVPPTEMPQPAPFPAISQINMLTASAGWGTDVDGHLYRSTDGGLTWLERSPQNFTGGLWGSAFLDADHAWLLFVSADAPLQILRTADGGQTWESISPAGLGTDGMLFLRFTSPIEGLAEVDGVGAGNRYVQVYATHDGGANWAVVPLAPFRANEELPTGTLHLCSLCGDSFYYDAARTLVVEGDMGSMEMRHAVHLYLTTDLGQNWREQSLPLPDQYNDALVTPLTPVFLGAANGFLPVHLLKYNADGTHAYDVVALYTTQDGGESWTLTPSTLQGAASTTFQFFFSPTEALLQCGPAFCVTRDAGQTWQTITPNYDIVSADNHWIPQIQFTDLQNGWLVVNDNNQYQLYHTTDGGATWALLNH